jgi:hypothetical protein
MSEINAPMPRANAPMPRANAPMPMANAPPQQIIQYDCIICLDTHPIYSWCEHCYSCRICAPCYIQLCGTGKQELCPCCRKKHWVTTTRPQTHPQLTPNRTPQTISGNINIPQLNTPSIPTVSPDTGILFINEIGLQLPEPTTDDNNSRDYNLMTRCIVGSLLIFIHIIQLMLLGICIHAIFIPHKELNQGMAIIYGLTVEIGILFIWRILLKIKNEYNNILAICCLPCNNFMQTQRQLYRVYNINESVV